MGRDVNRDLKFVIFEISESGKATITLNRPDVHNAFNAGVISELTQIFDSLASNDHVRMVVLRGNGKSFSAGADLEWMRDAAAQSKADNESDAVVLAAMLRKLYELPQMTLALVQGAAMGGGAGLVGACDVAVAMKGSKFRFSEVRLGVTPATISPFVIEAIGPRWAKALFVTAETFDANYAEKMGLVQYVVKDPDEMQQMEDYLFDLNKAAAPVAIAECKALVRDVSGAQINEDLGRDTAKRIAARRASNEGKEGISAFLEKRKPDWAE